MNKIQKEKNVCFGQTACKISYSNLCITFGTFIIVRHLSTRIRWTRSMKTELFENALQSGTCWKRCFRVYVRTDENGTFRKRSLEWNFLKTLFSRVRVDRQKRNFSKTLRTHYQFKSTPRNIRNLFKMADERFSFLSFILWLISNLIACFQGNLALLILQADYSRRRQTIIRLLSLPVSRGGRLDLRLVWLCFALILTF